MARAVSKDQCYGLGGFGGFGFGGFGGLGFGFGLFFIEISFLGLNQT
jgi:hypothetical protein